MTLPIWLDEKSGALPEACAEHVDVAIIGGGIIGAGCAYELGKRGGIKIALFDSCSLAHGSSGRNGGFVLRGLQSYYNSAVKRYGRDVAREIVRFGEQNQAMIKNFALERGNSFDLDVCGSYLLACSLEELDDLKETAAMMAEDGFEVELLKNDPTDREFYGAVHNPCDAAINPQRLVFALAQASGAAIYANEEVGYLEHSSKSGKIIVKTSKRVLACEKLLVATNAYAPLLEGWFRDKLQIVRGQIIVTQPLKKRILHKVCYANYGFEYFRQLPDQRLLLGGCRQAFLDEEVGYGDMLTRPVQQALENFLKARFGEFAGVPIEYRFSGMMAFTSDGLPMLGAWPRLPGAFYAVGCNGHGLSFGMNMSKTLVEFAIDGKDPGIFDAARDSLCTRSPAVVAGEKGP